MDEGVGRKGNGVIPGRCGDPGELLLAVAPSREPSQNNRVEEEQKFCCRFAAGAAAVDVEWEVGRRVGRSVMRFRKKHTFVFLAVVS